MSSQQAVTARAEGFRDLGALLEGTDVGRTGMNGTVDKSKAKVPRRNHWRINHAEQHRERRGNMSKPLFSITRPIDAEMYCSLTGRRSLPRHQPSFKINDENLVRFKTSPARVARLNQ